MYYRAGGQYGRCAGREASSRARHRAAMSTSVSTSALLPAVACTAARTCSRIALGPEAVLTGHTRDHPIRLQPKRRGLPAQAPACRGARAGRDALAPRTIRRTGRRRRCTAPPLTASRASSVCPARKACMRSRRWKPSCVRWPFHATADEPRGELPSVAAQMRSGLGIRRGLPGRQQALARPGSGVGAGVATRPE